MCDLFRILEIFKFEFLSQMKILVFLAHFWKRWYVITQLPNSYWTICVLQLIDEFTNQLESPQDHVGAGHFPLGFMICSTALYLWQRVGGPVFQHSSFTSLKDLW